LWPSGRPQVPGLVELLDGVPPLVELCDAPLRVYKSRLLAAVISDLRQRRLPMSGRHRPRRRMRSRIPASCRVKWRRSQNRKFQTGRRPQAKGPCPRAQPTSSAATSSAATFGAYVCVGAVCLSGRAIIAAIRAGLAGCIRMVRWLYGGEKNEVIRFMTPVVNSPLLNGVSQSTKLPSPNVLSIDEIAALNVLALPLITLRYGHSTALVPPAAMLHGMILCTAANGTLAASGQHMPLSPPPRFSGANAPPGSQLAAARNYARTQWLAKWYAHNNSNNASLNCSGDIQRQFLAAKKAYNRHSKVPMADVATDDASSASLTRSTVCSHESR